MGTRGGWNSGRNEIRDTDILRVAGPQKQISKFLVLVLLSRPHLLTCKRRDYPTFRALLGRPPQAIHCLLLNLSKPAWIALLIRASILVSCIWLFATLWTLSHQASLSMGFSQQEYWSGLPFPSLGDLPDPGIEPASLLSPALAGRFFTTELPGKPLLH